MLKLHRTDRSMGPVSFRAYMWLAPAVVAALIGCAVQKPPPTAPVMASSREDIFVLRSLREERIAKSDWCTPARTGFEHSDLSKGGFVVEDGFSMWAVATDADDGRIINAKVDKVGQLRACFGSTADPKTIGFFTEGRIASLTFTGAGTCVVLRPDFPEKGITHLRCFLELRNLPAPYVGGVLTTNTVNSKTPLGDTTDPVGYVQSSVATVRLWRAP
jgi:hypothetical protein